MTLADTITRHRDLYRDDLGSVGSPSQRTPPVAYTYDEKERSLIPDDRPLVYFDADGEYHEVPDSATQSTQIGMPMSGRMYRYLSGPSPETPWATALRNMRRECRAKHRHHRGPRHWNGSLCHQLTVFVVVHGYSAHNAARILEYDNPEPVLRWAFGEIERQIDEQRARQEKREREASGYGPGAVPLPEWEHKPLDGLHRAECPQCRKEDVA